MRIPSEGMAHAASVSAGHEFGQHLNNKQQTGPTFTGGQADNSHHNQGNDGHGLGDGHGYGNNSDLGYRTSPSDGYRLFDGSSHGDGRHLGDDHGFLTDPSLGNRYRFGDGPSLENGSYLSDGPFYAWRQAGQHSGAIVDAVILRAEAAVARKDGTGAARIEAGQTPYPQADASARPSDGGGPYGIDTDIASFPQSPLSQTSTHDAFMTGEASNGLIGGTGNDALLHGEGKGPLHPGRTIDEVEAILSRDNPLAAIQGHSAWNERQRLRSRERRRRLLRWLLRFRLKSRPRRTGFQQESATE